MTLELVVDPAIIRTTVTGVLATLPEWFGLPESTREYIDGAAACPCLVAKEGDQTLGFLSYRRTSGCAAEVFVMGVVPSAHRRGVGRLLVEDCVARLADEGYEFLTVKTLAASHPSPEYSRTRAFYLAQGFRPLEVLPDLWGTDYPCLYLVRPVRPGGV